MALLRGRAHRGWSALCQLVWKTRCSSSTVFGRWGRDMSMGSRRGLPSSVPRSLTHSPVEALCSAVRRPDVRALRWDRSTLEFGRGVSELRWLTSNASVWLGCRVRGLLLRWFLSVVDFGCHSGSRPSMRRAGLAHPTGGGALLAHARKAGGVFMCPMRCCLCHSSHAPGLGMPITANLCTAL